MKLKAIIFDFDGVIVDSTKIKMQAFEEMYLPYGQKIAREAKNYHIQNGGISRYEKFKFLHKEYLGITLSQEQIIELGNQFGNLVVEKVVSCPYIAGIYEFLQANYQKLDFFVSTGTPEKEAQQIVEKRNLALFFKFVYGSPNKKTSHLKQILQENHYAKSEVVFIGDATNDRDAAAEIGIPFIARYDDDTKLLASERYKIDDFVDFDNFLAKFF